MQCGMSRLLVPWNDMAHCLLLSRFDPNELAVILWSRFLCNFIFCCRGSQLVLIGDSIMTRLMNLKSKYQDYRDGKAGYALLWLLGVPLPVLALVYFLRGCN